MPSGQLHIFDPLRNFQLQGFIGRCATTTLHDASATGVSISGIFQAAEDFTVLGFYNAYDYFNHPRQKHLPRTDLSGLTLEFDIEYDHALDGAMCMDTAKYPSVSWDAMTFVCGKGAIHEVKLLNYAAVVSGGETPASMVIEAEGVQPYCGWDNLVVIFGAGGTPRLRARRGTNCQPTCPRPTVARPMAGERRPEVVLTRRESGELVHAVRITNRRGRYPILRDATFCARKWPYATYHRGGI